MAGTATKKNRWAVMSIEIKVPALGESVTEATVARWLKKAGEPVGRDEPLVELETDKATLEVNAPQSGVLSEVRAEEGQDVEVGAVLGVIEEAEAAAGKAAPPPRTEAAPAAAPAEKPATEEPAAEAPKAEEPKAEEPTAAETFELKVPALGESVTSATIAKWLKQAGDRIERDEPLVELETDKATLEVNAPEAGVLLEVRAETGQDVEVGAVLALIGVGAGAPATAPAPEEEAFIMPAARKLIEDHGLDAATVEGTGKGGRITKEDVLSHLERGPGAAPSRPAAAPAPAAAAGPATIEVPAFQRPETPPAPRRDREERVRMSKLRKTIAARLKQAQNTAAMLTTFNEVDMTAVMDLRGRYRDVFEKRHGVRLGFMGFFVKAVVDALQEFPAVNAEIDGDELVYKNYYDIGVAVGTPQGLVVPVVRDVDRLGFADIEKTIGDLGRRARDGKLTITELTGGTFTITNGGIYGSLMSTPILNPPQSGILGMHKVMQRPMVVNGAIEPRPMMYVALSYDHRIIDGSEAVSFLVRVKDCIEDPERLLLAV